MYVLETNNTISNKDFPPGNRNVSRPSDLSRHFIHFGKFETTPRLNLGQKGELLLQKMVNSFMIARDPYSRLWSAYLDKIFLPDFWLYLGRDIVRVERTNAAEYVPEMWS